eukprot:jgi/Phyca11/98397/e_gw1.2.954.1
MEKSGRKRLGASPYSTELLRRKRHEANVLRLEAETLSAQLQELQRSRGATRSAATLTEPRTSLWRPVAAAERKKRDRSQKTNRELKALLAELAKIYSPVLKTLIKTNALQIQRKAPTPMDMNAVASMLEGHFCNNVITTYRKYDEGDRVILVGTTKWFLPSGEFVLQDYNWTVISPTAADTGEACVMRHCYKLEMVTTSCDESAQAQKVVFRAVSSKMRNLHQVMQDKLLDNGTFS